MKNWGLYGDYSNGSGLTSHIKYYFAAPPCKICGHIQTYKIFTQKRKEGNRRRAPKRIGIVAYAVQVRI